MRRLLVDYNNHWIRIRICILASYVGHDHNILRIIEIRPLTAGQGQLMDEHAICVESLLATVAISTSH